MARQAVTIVCPPDGTVIGDGQIPATQTTLAAILAAQGGDTSDRVFSQIVIEQAAAGYVDLGVGAAGEDVRLEELLGTMRGLGTLQVHSDTDGAGTGESDLTGPMTFGAGGGVNKEFKRPPTSVADEHLSIELTGAGFDGWASISKGTP